MPNDLQTLRDVGIDPFSGIKVGAPRRYKRPPSPEWMRHRVKVREFLVAAFPKYKTDEGQRIRMMLWNAVITYYFNLGWSALDTEVQCEDSLRNLGLWRGADVLKRRDMEGRSPIHVVVQQIKRKAAGLNRDGSKKSAVGRGQFRQPKSEPAELSLAEK